MIFIGLVVDVVVDPGQDLDHVEETAILLGEDLVVTDTAYFSIIFSPCQKRVTNVYTEVKII